MLRRQDNARVLLAEADGFDLDERTVSATGPGGEPLTLGYDSLIVAAGAGGGMKTLDIRSRVLRAFKLAELATDERERADNGRLGRRRTLGLSRISQTPRLQPNPSPSD